MKKKNFCIFFILTCVFMSSCSSDDELYSCDPDANEWAKENLSEIRSMDRVDWLEIGDDTYQRASYNAFTSSQRFDFWVDKINHVLTLDWNDLEKEHIKILLDFIGDNRSVFKTGATEESEIFFYRWSEEAKEILGWNDQVVGSIIFTGSNVLNTTGDIAFDTKNNIRLRSGGESVCKCNASTVISACGSLFNQECITGGCLETTWGCGAMWTSECTGVCHQIF